MRAKASNNSSISTQQQVYLLGSILQQQQQDFAELWQIAFGTTKSKKSLPIKLKNQQSLYRLKGKGLVLLQTNFSKKPKNPV